MKWCLLRHIDICICNGNSVTQYAITTTTTTNKNNNSFSGATAPTGPGPPHYRVAQLVEALRYKPEGRGFDSQ
jgi:hypothetical protein